MTNQRIWWIVGILLIILIVILILVFVDFDLQGDLIRLPLD